jgi:hypothetical protein
MRALWIRLRISQTSAEDMPDLAAGLGVRSDVSRA